MLKREAMVSALVPFRYALSASDEDGHEIEHAEGRIEEKNVW
jgi:hypothetical protein